jgi:hypothetical protein
MSKLTDWLKQPSTITGIAAFVGTAAGLIAHYLTHDATLSVTVGGLVYGAVHVVVPDNTAAASSAEKLVTDAVNAIVQKKVAAMVPQLAADAFALFNAVSGTPAAAPPAASATSAAPTVGSTPTA